MKRFKFSLQGLLEAKQKQEDAAKQELARLSANKARIDRQIELLALARQTQDSQLRESLETGAAATVAVAAERYAASLTEQIAAQRLEAQAAQQEIDGQRARLVEFVKERRCFETLRERRLAVYHREALRTQFNTIDEMLLTRRKDLPHE